ncbi:hypothetical protein EPH_0004680 [Eimeria praecox]|uniref:Uncharacterized protein n=1 Tax=Eimeria praecox TaxID=51316 RepID=U6G7C7_9EIME|nr:hypothetical protein EPH_0004680 [Eimeria praecox]
MRRHFFRFGGVAAIPAVVAAVVCRQVNVECALLPLRRSWKTAAAAAAGGGAAAGGAATAAAAAAAAGGLRGPQLQQQQLLLLQQKAVKRDASPVRPLKTLPPVQPQQQPQPQPVRPLKTLPPVQPQQQPQPQPQQQQQQQQQQQRLQQLQLLSLLQQQQQQQQQQHEGMRRPAAEASTSPPKDAILRKYVTFEAWRRSCVAALNRAENFGDLRRLPQLRDAIVYILGAD